MYILISPQQISQLEAQHCTAEDWSTIFVHPELNLKYVREVRFSGTCRIGKFEKSFLMPGVIQKHSGIFHATLHNVNVGNDCCIENIKNYIANYDIEEDCFIENCDIILVDPLGPAPIQEERQKTGRCAGADREYEGISPLPRHVCILKEDKGVSS